MRGQHPAKNLKALVYSSTGGPECSQDYSSLFGNSILIITKFVNYNEQEPPCVSTLCLPHIKSPRPSSLCICIPKVIRRQ